MDERQRLWLRLHLTKGLGRRGLIRLQESFGSPEAVFESSPEQRVGRAGIRSAVAGNLVGPDDPRLLQAVETLERDEARLLTLWDEEYPPLLRQIHDPPALLYVRGRLPSAECVAVVGSRRATESGRRFTEQLCRELAEAGIGVVSGLARGVDAAAHRGALSGGGRTVGVLGCGIDRVYPPEHTRLFRQTIEHGCLLSEYAPGSEPLAAHFPGRNRIISGLCRGVVVVEAAPESGSLITADFALEQGRDVLAVPGPVSGSNSAGPHRLLKEGAGLVTDARDVLEALWPGRHQKVDAQADTGREAALSPPQQSVYRLLREEPAHIDEVIAGSGLTAMEVSDILLHLELEGAVESLPGMRYVRRSFLPKV